jgi:hypothetical protein
LGIYVRVIRRADRDQLRADLCALLGEDRPTDEVLVPRRALDQTRLQLDRDQREGFER